MLSGTGYTEYDKNGVIVTKGSNLSTAGAIALSGALLFNALAEGSVDAVENECITMDQCLSHPTPNGEYHYHSWSPCLQKGNGWASTT